MVYLITGGAGFIGSHLCEQLLENKDEVIVVDNLSTGSFKNIERFKTNQYFSFYVGDVREQSFLENIVKKCDIIYHLAAAVGVKLIIENPIETLESNIMGTHAVLRLAARYNRKTIITSTSEVYGKSIQKSFSEADDCVLGPSIKKRWSYACSKLADEFMGLAFHEEKGLPIAIVRLFNTVGPRQTSRYGMVIPTFVRQAIEGSPITVFGSGEQSRCFTHVGEIVNALIKIGSENKVIGEIINLGGIKPISISNLATMVKEITGSSSEIVYIPYDMAYERGFEDMERRAPNIQKAKRLIGFEPKIEVSDIIKDIFMHLNSNR